jgi:hypothetical protein
MSGASVMAGDTTSISSQFQEADVAMTMLNLATQDKLSAKAQAIFFNHMVSTAGIETVSPKREMYGEGPQEDERYKADKTEYEKSLKIQILKRVAGIPINGEEDGASSLFHGIEKDRRDSFIKAFDSFLDKEITIEIPNIGSKSYSSGVEFLSEQLETTAAGQRQSMLRSMINADDSFESTNKGKNITTDIGALAESLIKDPSDVDAVYTLMTELGRLKLGGGSHPLDKYKSMQAERMQKYEQILMKDYKMIERETTKAMRSSNALDYVAPLALTLLGSAVMTGGITEDMFSQIGGAAFISLAYSKQSFAKKAVYASAGAGFRLSNTIEQSGDADEGLARYVAQEAAFATGAMFVAPVIESGIKRTIARSIDPRMKYNDAVDDLNPLHYKLKSGAVLDVDKFHSAKTVSSSVTSALLSAVIGVTMGAFAGEMIAAPSKIKSESAIDLAIEGLSSTIRNAFNSRFESESTRDALSVEDEEGIEYIQHEKEVLPLEAIWESGIDPTSDVSYVHGVPGFVMMGVSLSSEEYS